MVIFASGIGLLVLAGIAGCALGRRGAAADRLFKWGAIGGCLLALIPAASVLVGLPIGAARDGLWMQGGARGWFEIDALSAWFLVVVLGAGAAIAAYGVPYLARERGHRRVGLAHLLLATLLAALSGIVTARTILAFMVCWEIMALCAYFLVIFEHEKREVWDAGMVYLVLTHCCTLALIGMFAAWSGGNVGARFEDLARDAGLGLVPASAVLMLGLLGFGIKAGMVPFHFWLPGAHASAPSHVSALLSGVMLKMGIYGLLRVLTLVGTPPAWWGWLVLGLGLASAVLGVLWALAQHDLKRLLAYHSVENIGIILIGLGVGSLGTAYDRPDVAMLGYAGALLHTLNHALFKSLLFLGAGVVLHQTGTREIDRLGGLVRRMPKTALAFLIAAIAIVGLPPLNGFVSEWLIFRGLLGTGAAEGNLRLAAVASVGLAVAGAMALACFTKLFAVVFLGTARDAGVPAHESNESAFVPSQWILASGCVVIGLAPALILPIAVRTTGLLAPGFVGSGDAPRLTGDGLALSALSAAIVAGLALLWAGRRAAFARAPRAWSATWGCAYPAPSSRMQYTASSYASPLLVTLGPVSGIRETRSPGSFRTHAVEPVLDLLGLPLWTRIVAAATRLRTLQAGRLRQYLWYSILCLFGLLLYLRYLALP
jgi:hydrogenase-4 component B